MRVSVMLFGTTSPRIVNEAPTSDDLVLCICRSCLNCVNCYRNLCNATWKFHSKQTVNGCIIYIGRMHEVIFCFVSSNYLQVLVSIALFEMSGSWRSSCVNGFDLLVKIVYHCQLIMLNWQKLNVEHNI